MTEDATTPLRGYVVMRKLSDKAGLKHPENMRCTKLRKHIATLSQLLGLKSNELEQLATHMGHNIEVHREYYRLPQETLLLAKMSKLLSVAEKGELHKNQGKSLSEIEVSATEQLDVTFENESDDEEEDNSQPEDVVAEQGDDETRQYKKWTPAQEKFLFAQQEIKQLTRKRKAPGRTLSELVIKRSKGLYANKTWKDIKNKVHNYNNSEKAKLKRQEKLLEPKKKKTKKL